jgi:hypothetical protein
MWHAAQGWPVWMAKDGTARAAWFVAKMSNAASPAIAAQATLRKRLRVRCSNRAAELRAAAPRNRLKNTLGISRPNSQAMTRENPNMINYPSNDDGDARSGRSPRGRPG